jgi:hypothetical protein
MGDRIAKFRSRSHDAVTEDAGQRSEVRLELKIKKAEVDGRRLIRLRALRRDKLLRAESVATRGNGGGSKN